ncbi:short-chain dehydrogenase/reductase SDR [Caballeronia catudaia]|uniref:Short-chain dehydrogenase/reductase SDR n=1 Tax=Caballeronia catudaia TaxID=1777136 RepID=A0A158B8Q9_9BURK|nr:short-chain dehydrogenase/reductase SDR [Caballeronia catudaia]
MAQAAARAMQQRGAGAIVQTGSLWALQAIGATPSAAYSAANAGVHALKRNLAIDLVASNIRINTVAPAVVETPVFNTFMSDDQVKATLPAFNAFHPLGRNDQPADVAEAILFLAFSGRNKDVMNVSMTKQMVMRPIACRYRCGMRDAAAGVS